MPGILGRKWPAPVARVMWPFYTAGIIVLYGVDRMARAMSQTDEFKNDPRNPYRKVKPDSH